MSLPFRLNPRLPLPAVLPPERREPRTGPRTGRQTNSRAWPDCLGLLVLCIALGSVAGPTWAQSSSGGNGGDEATAASTREQLSALSAMRSALAGDDAEAAESSLAALKRPDLRSAGLIELGLYFVEQALPERGLLLLDSAEPLIAQAESLPVRIQLWQSLGEAFCRAGRFDRANAAFDASIRLFPEQLLPLEDQQNRVLRMIDAMAQAGDFAGAWSLAQRNRNLVGEVTSGERITGALVLRVQELAAEGRFESARELCGVIDHWMPTVAGYAALAKVERQAGHPEESERDFARALVVAMRNPDLRERFMAARLVAHYRARADDPLMWVDYQTVFDLIARFDSDYRITREVETTIEGFMLARSLDDSDRLISVVKDPYVRALTVAEFARRRIDRIQMLDGLILLRQLDRLREEIESAERRDALLAMELEQRQRLIVIRYSDGRVAEARGEVDSFAELADGFQSDREHDRLVGGLVQSLVRARDFAYAMRMAELIRNGRLNRETMSLVNRAEISDQARERVTSQPPVSRTNRNP